MFLKDHKKVHFSRIKRAIIELFHRSRGSIRSGTCEAVPPGVEVNIVRMKGRSGKCKSSTMGLSIALCSVQITGQFYGIDRIVVVKSLELPNSFLMLLSNGSSLVTTLNDTSKDWNLVKKGLLNGLTYSL